MRDAVHPRLKCRRVISKEMARHQSKDSGCNRFVGVSFLRSVVLSVTSFRRLTSSSHCFIVPGVFIVTAQQQRSRKEVF